MPAKTKTPAKKPNLGGRPTAYTKEIGERICLLLIEGYSLRQIYLSEKEKKPSFPDKSTILRWLAIMEPDDAIKAFQDHYARARGIQADNYADEIIEISDDSTNDWVERENQRTGETYTELNHEHIQRSRLRVDSRKWIMSKLLPKKYGDKVTQEHTGAEGGAIQYTHVVDRPAKETPEQWLSRVQKEIEERAKSRT